MKPGASGQRFLVKGGTEGALCMRPSNLGQVLIEGVSILPL